MNYVFLYESQVRIEELRNIVSTVFYLSKSIIRHRRAIKRYRFQQVHISAASFYDSRCSEEFHATETELIIIRHSTQSYRFKVFRNYLAILTSFHSFCSLLLPTSSQKKTNRTPLQFQDYLSTRIAEFYWTSKNRNLHMKR